MKGGMSKKLKAPSSKLKGNAKQQEPRAEMSTLRSGGHLGRRLPPSPRDTAGSLTPAAGALGSSLELYSLSFRPRSYTPRVIGQFFTPEIVARCLFLLTGTRAPDRVIDPSCGDGSFVRHAPAGCAVFACEIDPRYIKISSPLVPAGHFFAGDALTALREHHGTFDLAIGNPPFSAQAHLEKRPEVQSQFDLAAGRRSQCLEVLFLELFLKLVKPGGHVAIILPDGPFSNRPFQYVRDWLLRHATVLAIISLPRGIFSRTTAKTNVLIARKLTLAERHAAASASASPAAPAKHPAWLFQCRDLGEFATLAIPGRTTTDARWQRVDLTTTRDWRPEAHLVATTTPPTAPADTVRLGDVFRVRHGFALYGEQRNLLDQPAPDRILLIRAKNLAPTGGLRLAEKLAHIRRDSGCFRERALVQPGEILFVRVGIGCYGRAAVMPPGLVAQADDWFHLLTPLTDFDTHGVVAWMHSDEGRRELLKMAKGVGTLSISQSSLSNLLLPGRLIRGPVSAATPPPVAARKIRAADQHSVLL